MSMKLLNLIKHLMGQVTEYKHYAAKLRNDLLSDGVKFVSTCPVFAGPVLYNELLLGVAICR